MDISKIPQKVPQLIKTDNCFGQWRNLNISKTTPIVDVTKTFIRGNLEIQIPLKPKKPERPV